MGETLLQRQNFVAGHWVGAVDGATEQIVNPATELMIAEVPKGSVADVDRAVAAAKDALPEWLETTPGERAGMLLRLADAVVDNADE